MPESVDILERELGRLRPIFEPFHKAVKNRANLRHRQSGERFTSQMPGLENELNIASARLEKQYFDWLAALKLNTSKVDVLSLDTDKTAERAVEDIRVWDAHELARMNDGRVLDDAMYGPPVSDGLAYIFQGWKEPPEPDPDDLKTGINPDDSDETKSRKTEQARTKFFEKWLQDNEVFPWVSASPREMMHWPLGDPRVFIQESEIDLHDAGNLKHDRSDETKVELNREGQVVFTGPTQPTEEWRSDSTVTSTSSKLYFCRMARRVDGIWYVSEWVKGTNQKDNEYERLREYRAPFKDPPYVIVPSGFEDRSENSDPLHRYRPGLAALYVDVEEENALRTLFAELTVIQITKRGYVSLSGVRPEVVQMFANAAGAGVGQITGQGAGAEKYWTLQEPEASTDELPVSPGRIEPWPLVDKMLDYVREWLNEVKENIARDSLNRFVIGEALPDAQYSSGTFSLQQAQAAQAPLLSFITAADHAKETLLEMRHQAIQHWDTDEDGEIIDTKPFVFRRKGDEPIARGQAERGGIVTIDAKKLQNPHQVVVHTTAESQAEAIQRKQQATFEHEKGALPKDEWLRQMGSPDPKITREEIWADQMEGAVDAQYSQLYLESIRTTIAATTEVMPPPPIDPSLLQGNGQGGQGGPAGPTQPPGIGIMNGSAPAVGGPEVSTTGMA